MNSAVSTSLAPAAIGPYSQGLCAGEFVFVSGQLPLDPSTGAFPEGDIRELTRRSLTNIRNILAEAGLKMTDVVKTTVMMTDLADFAAMNEVYAEFFEAPYPARSAFEVKALPKGSPIEIECIAVRP